jgi:hypothetical protein
MTRPPFKRLVTERRVAEEAACAEVDAADLSGRGIHAGAADAEAGTVPADIVHAECAPVSAPNELIGDGASLAFHRYCRRPLTGHARAYIAAVHTTLAEETPPFCQAKRWGAEGATAPEPLRQMDRKLMALWKAAGPPAGSPKG